MRKSYLILKSCLLFVVLAPVLARMVMYFAGMERIDSQPLLVVAIFAGIAGALLGLAKAEDCILV